MPEISDERATLRLTSLSHGGGCGCKLAPAVLEQIIAKVRRPRSDSAPICSSASRPATMRRCIGSARIRRSSRRPTSSCRSSTIPSTSAPSPRPMPSRTSTPWADSRSSRWRWWRCRSTSCRSTRSGGFSKAANRSAGAPAFRSPAATASIRSKPIYGLVAIGLVDPRHVKRNADARPGDKIVLGKALGVGVYGAAIKKQKMTDAQYRELIASTTQLNTPGMRLARLPGVHALTDVTGFGLLGHLLEVCRGSGVRATVRWSDVPLLPDARELAAAGYVTGGSTRNWQGYGKPRRSDQPRRRRAGASDRSADERRPAGRVRARGRRTRCSTVSAPTAFDRAAVIGEIEAGIAGHVGGVGRTSDVARCTVGWKAESDTCLVVVTVFKIVAPALCAGGWVRFLPSPPTSSLAAAVAAHEASRLRAIPSVDKILQSLGDTGLPARSSSTRCAGI